MTLVETNKVQRRLEQLNIHMKLSENNSWCLKQREKLCLYESQEIQCPNPLEQNQGKRQSFYYRAMIAEEVNLWLANNISQIIEKKDRSIPFASCASYSDRYLKNTNQQCAVLEFYAPDYQTQLQQIVNLEDNMKRKESFWKDNTVGIGFHFPVQERQVSLHELRKAFTYYQRTPFQRAFMDRIIRAWNIDPNNIHYREYIQVLRPVLFVSSIQTMKLVKLKA